MSASTVKPSGQGGVQLALIRRKDRVRIQIEIDTGGKDRNKKIFAALWAKRAEHEAALGYEIEWLEQPDIRVSRIVGASHFSELTDTESWPDAIQWLSESIKRFYEVFKGPIRAAAESA